MRERAIPKVVSFSRFLFGRKVMKVRHLRIRWQGIIINFSVLNNVNIRGSSIDRKAVAPLVAEVILIAIYVVMSAVILLAAGATHQIPSLNRRWHLLKLRRIALE
jgi:hypothetical protein